MKKQTLLVSTLIVIVSMLLSACLGSGKSHQYLAPTDPNYVPGQNVAVDNSPTLQEKYDECLKGIDQNIVETWIPTNEYGEMAAQVWYCGDQQSALMGGMVLVPAQRLTSLTPGNADNAVLYGIAFVKNVGYFAVLMAASYIVGDAIAYTVADKQAIAWTNDLTDVAENNVVWSLNHAESQEVVNGTLAYSRSGYLRRQGPGNNSGSIEIWAGVSGNEAIVAIVMIVGTQVNYAAIKGDVLQWGAKLVPGTYLNLGNGLAMDTSKARWTAAWRMSKTIGHEAKPQSEFLNVGQGLMAWKAIQQRYNLYIPVVEIILPPSPF